MRFVPEERRVRVAVDIGGTFTDLVAYDPGSQSLWFSKASTVPHALEEGIVDCLNQVPVDLAEVAFVVHGTTLVINAVLERKGAKTALITTRGFRDVLEIARGNRPEAFNVLFTRHEPLVPRPLRLEVDERLAADGSELVPLDKAQLRGIGERLRGDGVEAIAVCFLHSYRNPAHEEEARRLLTSLGPWYVSASSELSREYREYERTSTTVINAFVGPLVQQYLGAVEHRLARHGFTGRLFLMQSNNGIATVPTAKRMPVLLMESGPVGGIAGVQQLGAVAGEYNFITFDMGGTTAKAALIEDGRVSFDTIYYVGGYAHGYPVQAPVVDIVEVGAGGGSIAWIDQLGALRVGPRSAGAHPGPAAYGLGNAEPTVTDANLLLGRIDGGGLLGGKMTVYPELAREALSRLGSQLGYDVHAMAVGIIKLANLTMASAIRRVSVERGKDPRDFVLVVYGGNGPVHGAELAAELGIRRMWVPPMPGVFSALGMLLADIRYDAVQTVPMDLGRDELTVRDRLAAEFEQLEKHLIGLIREAGALQGPVRFERFLEMRYRGQDHTVKVPVTDSALDPATLRTQFESVYRSRYGHISPIPVQVVSARVAAEVSPGQPVRLPTPAVGGRPAPIGSRVVHFMRPDTEVSCPVYWREHLPIGWRMPGPAVVDETTSSTLVPGGWTLEVLPSGILEVRKEAK